MNMSYCRFENTYNDVKDCMCAIDDGGGLSEREARYAKRLFKEVLSFLYDNGFIEEYTRENADDIDEWIDGLSADNEQEG